MELAYGIYWGWMDAYFASGAHETLFELAAQEQAGIVTSYHGDIAKAVKDTNNPKDYGPVFVGKMKIHKLANYVEAAAKQFLGDIGEVYIYSHGYTAGLSPDGVAYLTPEHITTALEGRPGKKHSIKRVWALGCNFGNKGGGASKWAEILGIKVNGHINTGDIGLETAYKLTFWGKGMEDLHSDVLAGFKKLRKDAFDGNITAKAFMDGWEKEFEKQKKRGCIKKAYWHVNDRTPTYETYPK